MNLMDLLGDAGANSAMAQLGRNFGLDSAATNGVLQHLAPALSRGLQRNTAQPQGLEALANALAKGNHQRYVDDPNELNDAQSQTDGNAILGHLFGSKDVSRNVAGHAANESGVSSEVIKKMLPIVAAIAMGALSKKTNAGHALGALGGQQTSTGTSSLLSSLLDADGDGSIADDVLDIAKKFF